VVRRAVAQSDLVRLGWQVTCVPNVAEALRRADEERPARILVPPMPPGEAMAIGDRLKQHAPTAHILLLMPADQLAFLGMPGCVEARSRIDLSVSLFA
jgi:CheY-like chemotaxis protein